MMMDEIKLLVIENSLANQKKIKSGTKTACVLGVGTLQAGQ